MRADKIIDALTREQADCRNHIKNGDQIDFDGFDSTVCTETKHGRCIRVYRNFIVVRLKVVEETVNRWDIQSVNGHMYRYGGRDRQKSRRN